MKLLRKIKIFILQLIIIYAKKLQKVLRKVKVILNQKVILYQIKVYLKVNIKINNLLKIIKIEHSIQIQIKKKKKLQLKIIKKSKK